MLDDSSAKDAGSCLESRKAVHWLMLIQCDICVTLPKVTCEETSIRPNKDKLVKLTCSQTLTQWLACYCLQLK